MKRIFTSLLVVLVALLIPNTIWAADPDLTNDYTLVKSITWGDGTNIAGSGSCAYTAYDTGNKKQQSLTILTAPEDAVGWIAMQAWTDGSGKGWWNRSDKGLYCVSAGRSACVYGDDLTTGWLVVFECSQTASNVITLTNASGEPDGTFSYVASEDGKSYFCTITAAENAYIGFCGNKNAGFINKISVYKPNKAVVPTTYTVKYQDMSGNALKDSVKYDAIVGASISLSDADKANITVGETTYVYDSDDTEGVTVAENGATVVIVKFHAAANFNYTVNEVCGETNARVTNGTSYETANVKLGYRKYNAVNGQLYKKDAVSKEFNYSFKLTQDNQVENIAYTIVDGTNNVVFCAEGEDIEGLTPITEGNTTIRSSNSSSAFAPADTKITTLAPGKYKIHAAIYDCATSPNSDWTFMVGAIQAASFNCTTVNIQEFDSQEFAIGRETDLVMLKAGSSSRGLDAIYILKTGDVTPDEAADLNAAADSIAAIVAAKADFQADITAAKAIDTIGKNGAAELAAAITAAETALAAAEATVDSITVAKAELAKAVAAFEEANKPAFDPATAIVNAGFNPEADPLGWDKVTSAQYYDLGMGLIGTYQVRGEHSASTVDETHLATEFAAGLECRWNTNYAAFTQTTAELPAGAYKLTFDVENTNATTTKANYENRFNVTVGETTYADESTEWMDGKSAWTTHTIAFTLTEASPITISLGYGTGSNNFGVGNTPALFVSHLTLEAINSIEIALIDLQAAIEVAQAKAATYTVGTEFFTYAESEIKPLNDAIATAQAAYTAAESAEAVKSATETLNAFVATFAPVMNKPAADKEYVITNKNAELALSIGNEAVKIEKEGIVKFTEVEGGWVLSNNLETPEYVFKTTGNTWTLSTTANKDEAYVVNFNLADGAYTIQGANGLFGTDNITEGSAVYANKAQSNNGLWTVAEYVAPVEPEDYTSYIVNADLTGEGGFDATGTKGIDGSGIVKVANASAFDFKQTIANLPAGKYKVTAQAAYRYGADETAEAAAIAAETDTKLVQLYATVGEKTVSAKVQNRYDGASETDYANGDGSVTVNEKFVPNSSNAVKAWFAAGKYVNELVFNVPADGAVTIGINRTGTPESDYTVIGPWTLTRLGDAEVEPEPEPTPEPGADMTAKIVNPSFEDGTTGWTYEPSNDHGAKENSNATYTMSNCDGNYIFNIWSSGNAISQKVVNLPNGVYKMKAVIATDANQKVQLNANGKSVQIDAVGKETGVEGELEFNVLDNTATIGAEGVNKYWYKVDNFRLTYVKAIDIATLVTDYETALADAQAIEGEMNRDVAEALNTVISAEVDKTDVDALIVATNALNEAIATAKASVAAYKKVAHMKELVESTNVYTQEAYNEYYGQWEVKYITRTLTTEEAAPLQDPFIVTGWRASTTVDNFLLSAWDTNPDFPDGVAYYINSWSTEGENDGSNFKVPFFEYWTGDANSLGEKTLTATMSNLEAGDYDVTAWVRVRAKNGYTAPAYGITLSANDGEAVNVAAGDQVGESQFYLKEFTATGTVAADGVLNIKFNVAADNNISWLSFKNVKFEKKAAAEEFEEVKVTYALKADETHKSADVVEVKNEEEIVVATLTFGEAGGADFKAAKANAAVEGFEAFTEGNGVNGNSEGGTFYTIVPKFDGKVDVAVVLNADKSFYISEDGTVLADFDGITVSEKMYGTFTFDVKAEKAYKVYAAGTKLGFYGFNYTYKVAKQPEPQDTELALVLNVERYPGMGYGVTEATVDFTEAKAFLGVEAITTDMLSIVNPDSTTISDYAPYDGWFNGEGAAETWGNNTKVCVKFFEAIAGEGKYSICDMNGADEVGKTYSVKWQLAANDKKVIYTINVTFVEKPVITLTFADLTKKDEQTVALTSTLGSNYEGLTADVDIAAILAKLEVSSLNDVTIYAVQSDGSLDDQYKLGTTDGWRNAAGDWQTWGENAYFCVKTDFAAESSQIYYVGGMEGKNTTAEWETPASYTATYAFVKTGTTDAVVLKVTLTYTVPTGINTINTAIQNGNVYNMNGQKVNKSQKGLYIINGKKVVVK